MTMQRNRCAQTAVAIIGGASVIGMAPLALGDVVYSTFGTNSEYTNIFQTIGPTGQPVMDFERAVEFTVNGPDVVLTWADIAALRVSSGGTRLRAAVYLSTAQGPDALLEESEEFDLTATWNQQTGAVSGEVMVHAPFSGTTLLHSGQTYWLGVREVDGAYLGWYRADVAPFVTTYMREVGGAWTAGVVGRLAVRINGNAAPQCDGDVNGSGEVNIDDLITVILAWGPCLAPPALCPADIGENGAVDVDDLIAVIAGWGQCNATVR